MTIFCAPRHLLTDSTDRLGVLLTLFFFAVFPLHCLSAADPTTNLPQYTSRYTSAIDANAANDQRTAMLVYVRSQFLALTPSLSDDVRGPVHWVTDSFRSGHSLFDFGISSSGTSATAPAANPLLQSLPPEAQNASWLASTNYHHGHGFLPTHDAMMLGGHARQGMLGDAMKFDLHPYYGQNYFSANGIYGADVSLDLAAPDDVRYADHPWGKITFGYANGQSQMTDNGRGITMNGTVNFNQHLSLNSGIRQSDASGQSNFVLLQWKIATE